MPGLSRGVAGLWRALERFGAGPRATPAIAGAALAVYALVAVAWPLADGRDLGTYLRAAFELRSDPVVFPNGMLTRAPVTGVVSEGLLAAGPFVAEAAMALLYAASIVCWWLVARRVGPGAGIVVAIALLAYPGYALLFHRLSSDSLYAVAFAVVALAAARAIERPTGGRAAALGAGIALLVLVRPVSQVLILLTPLILLAPGAWRVRTGRFAAVAVAAVLPLARLGRSQRRPRGRLHGRPGRRTGSAALSRVRRRRDRRSRQRRCLARARGPRRARSSSQ